METWFIALLICGIYLLITLVSGGMVGPVRSLKVWPVLLRGIAL